MFVCAWYASKLHLVCICTHYTRRMFVCILDIGLNPFQTHSTYLQAEDTKNTPCSFVNVVWLVLLRLYALSLHVVCSYAVWQLCQKTVGPGCLHCVVWHCRLATTFCMHFVCLPTACRWLFVCVTQDRRRSIPRMLHAFGLRYAFSMRIVFGIESLPNPYAARATCVQKANDKHAARSLFSAFLLLRLQDCWLIDPWYVDGLLVVASQALTGNPSVSVLLEISLQPDC